MARVGIFPGTFDPVHAGHLAFAQAARRTCQLDRIVFVPEALPRGKQDVSLLAHRLAMLELALAGKPELEALQLDSQQFTIEDTLPELHAQFPADQLVLLLGSDVVATFGSRWPQLEKLFAEVELAIGLREGSNAAQVTAALHALAPTFGKARFACVSSPHPTAASSLIRHRAAEVLPELVTYLQQHHLYV